ncbi:hypothetical protein SBA4_1030005 [Candidatus Sulfopaludibacter sp. SbA4]|nr:hypothetical protein SBA4_1030005 [Candidatus Sulfopaludibacter sp. SbA4]
MNNPIVQVLMLFVGAYTALNVLGKVPPLDKIATILCGLIAAIIWMANYNRSLLYSLAQKPVLGPVINAVCKLCKEQPPVDPSMDAAGSADPQAPAKQGEQEAPKLLLHSDGDFASATRQIKEVVKGHNDVVEVAMDQLKRNVQLRDSSSVQVSLPPIGIFVFAGKPGLGKKLLATEIGYRLYKGSSVSILDVSDPGAGGGLLISEARSSPYTTFILENFQNCPAATQEDLLSIVSGAPQVDPKTGSKVSFRHCFFFLLVHRDAEGMERPSRKTAGGTGHTMVVESLGQSMSLDKRLAWSLHGVYPFVLPPPLQQAEVIAQIMQEECRKYNVNLGRVDPAILAREVQVVSSHGGFEITPLRVTKIMSNRLAAAVAAKEQLIDLADESRAATQRGY